MKSISIYRYNPLIDRIPWIQTIGISTQFKFESGSMVLDWLFTIKDNIDRSLSFRKSCREGICGSCAMNINGYNTLACIRDVSTITDLVIYPLPHLPIVKDLIIDLNHFYQQYKYIEPYLKKNEFCVSKEHFFLNTYCIINRFNYTKKKKKISWNIITNIKSYYYFKNNKYDLKLITNMKSDYREQIQSKRNRLALDGLYECILCACCSTACPSWWWNRDLYLGPAMLLQSYRWIIDSRDNAYLERIRNLDDVFKLYRCHGILNCTHTCPKKLNPAKAIFSIEQIINLA